MTAYRPYLLLPLACGLLSGAATAQPQAPAPRPTFTSYFSLLRPSVGGFGVAGGGAFGFGGPGPAAAGFAQQQQAQQLQQQLNATNQNLANLQALFAYGTDPALAPTGRGAAFNNLGHWYPAAPGGGGSGFAPRTGGGMSGRAAGGRTAGNGVPLGGPRR